MYWIVYFYLVQASLACGAGVGEGEKGEKDGVDGAGVGTDDFKNLPPEMDLPPPGLPPEYIKGIGDNPNYWAPPPGLTDKDIQDLIKKEYQKILDYVKNMSSSDRKRPPDADDDWPDEWTDVGFPYRGSSPPKYAIMPKAASKADICFLPPIVGACTPKRPYGVHRWGYNPFTEKCQKFLYSGCGGNQNNFFTQKRCDEVCVGDVGDMKSSCQIDSNNTLSIDDTDWYKLPTIPPTTTEANAEA